MGKGKLSISTKKAKQTPRVSTNSMWRKWDIQQARATYKVFMTLSRTSRWLIHLRRELTGRRHICSDSKARGNNDGWPWLYFFFLMVTDRNPWERRKGHMKLRGKDIAIDSNTGNQTRMPKWFLLDLNCSLHSSKVEWELATAACSKLHGGQGFAEKQVKTFDQRTG